MCLVILLCTRASPQGPGFPCQGKGTMLPGDFLAKGVFLQSPAAQQGALGASRWERCWGSLWAGFGSEKESSLLGQRVTMATPQRQECGEREHHAGGGLLLSLWG